MSEKNSLYIASCNTSVRQRNTQVRQTSYFNVQNVQSTKIFMLLPAHHGYCYSKNTTKAPTIEVWIDIYQGAFTGAGTAVIIHGSLNVNGVQWRHVITYTTILHKMGQSQSHKGITYIIWNLEFTEYIIYLHTQAIDCLAKTVKNC